MLAFYHIYIYFCETDRTLIPYWSMKTRIITWAILVTTLFCTSPAFAQNKTFVYVRAQTMKKEVYSLECQLVLDLGKPYKTTSLSGYFCLIDDKGVDIRFNSPADALNFLGKQGWELVAYTQETEDALETYILKKETTGMTDEQIDTFLLQYKLGDAKTSKKLRKELR